MKARNMLQQIKHDLFYNWHQLSCTCPVIDHECYNIIKVAVDPSCDMGFADYFHNVTIKLIVNNMTDTWKTDVNCPLSLINTSYKL